MKFVVHALIMAVSLSSVRALDIAALCKGSLITGIALKNTRDVVAGLSKKNARVIEQYELFANNIAQARAEERLSDEQVHKITGALQFAAMKHATQTRKDAEYTPYIIHPIGVANHALSVGKITDHEILMAALLHDTVEDTQTTFDELKIQFGAAVMEYVREVTDDKALPKEKRKALQIEHAQHTSPGATIIKLCDKWYNLNDLLNNAPQDWPRERVQEYFSWADAVVQALPKVNTPLEDSVAEIVKKYRSL